MPSLTIPYNFTESSEDLCNFVADGLYKNTNLNSLDLSRNYLGSMRGEALYFGFQDSKKCLTFLNSYISTESSENLCNSVADVLYQWSHLRTNNQRSNIIITLELHNSNLDSKRKIFAITLCNHNYFGLVRGETLAKTLYVNYTLISLDLEANNLGIIGGRSNSRSAATNYTLTSLYLSRNNLNDEKGKALAKVLHSNIALTTLDLSNNNIPPKAEKDLWMSFAKTPHSFPCIRLTNSSNKRGKLLQIFKCGISLANALCENKVDFFGSSTQSYWF
ncbi:protein NLRC3-like [Gigaspora margarita]|uniref:Protein NLRC3-like n=1 Tax=Gigaspora margarita TaxID=4874 RepID=A0A8H4A5D5_GIGMA|nr:protein NLRC3-like [Gigaspora margarita]